MESNTAIFPPVVVGTVITAIGISLFPVGGLWMSGGAGFGAQPVTASDMGLTFFSLATVLLVMRFGSVLRERSAILIGLLAGCLLAFCLGDLQTQTVASASWFGAVLPFA